MEKLIGNISENDISQSTNSYAVKLEKLNTTITIVCETLLGSFLKYLKVHWHKHFCKQFLLHPTLNWASFMPPLKSYTDDYKLA